MGVVTQTKQSMTDLHARHKREFRLINKVYRKTNVASAPMNVSICESTESGKTPKSRPPIFSKTTVNTYCTGALLAETVRQLGRCEALDESFDNNTKELLPAMAVRYSAQARFSHLVQTLMCSLLYAANVIASNSGKKKVTLAMLKTAFELLEPSYTKHGIQLSTVNLPRTTTTTKKSSTSSKP